VLLQVWHTETNVAAITVENVSTAHRVQTVLPTSLAEYDPAAQFWHVVMALAAMTLENFPATQSIHMSEVAAIAGEY
jgi:hypothetical protein